MKRNLLRVAAASALFVAGFGRPVFGANVVWTGSSGSDLFWSTAGNWSPGATPGTNDDALFFNQGAVNNETTYDNIVSSNLTVRALRLGQTNGIHNVFINSGVTLTVSGTNDNGYGPLGSNPSGSVFTNGLSTLYAGLWPSTNNSATTISSNTISGGGTLVVINTNNEMNVRQTYMGGGGSHQAVLDMSHLNNFFAQLGRIRVGDGETQPITRAQGQLWLARTNIITLSGINSQDNVQLVVGNNDVNNNGNSGASTLYLGLTNSLYVDEILVGGKKTPGNMLFNTNFTLPSLFMRGSDGVSRVGEFRIGDESDQTGSGNGTTGTADFTAGSVDILADTIIVGKSQSSSGASATGILRLGAGSVDVNTLEVGYLVDRNTAANAVSGTVAINNTKVTVNSLLQLGRLANGGIAPRNATLTMNGGSLTVNGSYTNAGTVTINVTNATMTLPPGSVILANNIMLDGGTITNAGEIKATNSLTILDGGSIPGAPLFDMGNNGLANWEASGAPGNGLVVSNAFQGSGNYEGNLTEASGASLIPGGSRIVGTLNINQGVNGGGNLTLNGGTLQFDLSASGSGANDQIIVSGTTTLNGVNNVNLTALGGLLDKSTPYTLITSGTLSGDQSHFAVTGPLTQSRYTFSFDTTSTANSVKLDVGGSDPASLTWVGDGSANAWDLKSSANWNNGAGSSQFFNLDSATLDDSGSASPALNLVGTLVPGLMTVNNSTKDYTLSGTGGLFVSGAMTKSGAGNLTFNNSAADSFSSLVTVQAGNVTFSNTGQNTFFNGLTLSGGSLTFTGNNGNSFVNSTPGVAVITIGSGTTLSFANSGANTFNGSQIQLDGMLAVNQSADSTLDGVVTGGGTLTKAGTGTLTVSAANTFGAAVQISGGTVKTGDGAALGSIGAVINNTGTLDLDGQNLASLPISVSGAGAGGNGAIVNTGAPLLSGSAGVGLSSVTLNGNATIGGSGPWNTDPVKDLGAWGITGSLSTGGAGYSLTKVGLNQISLNGATVDNALGDINVQQGLLDLAGGTTSLGNPANTVTVSAGATVSFNATSTPWNKKFALNGDGVTPDLLNYNGNNVIAGPVTLTGNCVVSAVGTTRGTTVSMALNGPIGGTGGLVKPSVDTLILAGTNNYSGPTTLTAGTTLVDGPNLGNGSVSVQGCTLAGMGVISGPVTLASDAVLAPGDPNISAVGQFTISNNLVMNGATVAIAELDPTTNGNVFVSGNLTLTGVSQITFPVPNGQLTQGTIYDVITYKGTLTGTSNNLELISPPFYTFSLLDPATTPGRIRVKVDQVPATLTWNGGASGAPTLWDNGVTTNWLNGSTSTVFIASDIVNFNDSPATNLVTLSGTLQPESAIFANNSTTYTLSGSGMLSGIGSMVLNGGGTVIIDSSGSNDFSGGVTINGGTLQVGKGDGNGNLGVGPVTNSSLLVLTTTNLAMPNVLYGGGGLIKDSNGVVTLTGDNLNYDGSITVARGTLRVDGNNSLGDANGGTVVNSGATLDVGAPDAAANALAITNEPIQVGGSGVTNGGAIINSTLVAQQNALRSVTLTTNATFGGAGRWDIRGNSTYPGSLSTGNLPYSLTKVGPNQVSLVGVTVDSALTNIDIQQGTLGFESGTTSMGDPNGTLTVHSGATLEFFNSDVAQWSKNFAFSGNGSTPTVTNQSGNTTIIGPILLTGNCVFGIASTGLTCTATISGAGGLVKTGSSVLTLGGINAYTGNTMVNAGSLALTGSGSISSSPVISLNGGMVDVSGRGDQTLTLSSQTLTGNGKINGMLASPAGTQVSPGTNTTVGTITVSNIVTLGGSTIMKLKGNGTNDQLNSTLSMQFGGALTVTNVGNPMAGGEVFHLFSAPAYSGAFAITNALPVLTPNLGWDTSQLGNGTLMVTGLVVRSIPHFVSVSLSGTNVVLGGTNGTPSNNYYVLSSTNVAQPLANWTRIATNTFNSSGNFAFTNAVSPNAPQKFYILQQ